MESNQQTDTNKCPQPQRLNGVIMCHFVPIIYIMITSWNSFFGEIFNKCNNNFELYKLGAP